MVLDQIVLIEMRIRINTRLLELEFLYASDHMMPRHIDQHHLWEIQHQIIIISILGQRIKLRGTRWIKGPYEGNVYVKNENGTWKPVCSSGWKTADATVICRMLG